MTQTIDVERLTAVKLEEGEVLFVELPDGSPVRVQAAWHLLAKKFGEENVIVVGPGVKLMKVLKKDHESGQPAG